MSETLPFTVNSKHFFPYHVSFNLQGKGVMPDGTTRLSKDGKDIFHFMGCSTFAEYAVIAEISAAKIHPGADLYEVRIFQKCHFSLS